MKIAAIDIARFPVPFKVAFKHASATRSEAENVIVIASSETGSIGYGEGCPRDYVTGETVDSARVFLRRERDAVIDQVDGLEALKVWIGQHEADIDANPAAFCALEMALLDLLGKERRQPLEALLELPPIAGDFRYSAILGNSHPIVFRWQLFRYRRAGFHDFKLKLSGDLERDRGKLKTLRSRVPAQLRVRLDANNLWRSPGDCVRYIEDLAHPGLFALEEPLAPDRADDLLEIARRLEMPIILDESFRRSVQLSTLPGEPRHWIVNCRISKLGGIIRSLDAVREACGRGVRVIIGAHVGETSLLSRAALALAQCAGEMLVAQEGAFGTRLLKRDLCIPCLMFGAGGILASEQTLQTNAAGLGLEVRRDMLELLC